MRGGSAVEETMVMMMMSMTMMMMMVMMRVNGVSMNYYGMSCPMVELIVRDTVGEALHRDPTLAAGLLRMHFHDCFVEGCDASVLLDSTKQNTAEKDSPANLSLRGYEVIDRAKERAEEECPGVVSCSDIVAMAARDAVFFAGGPLYDIPKGRKDGFRSKIEDTFNLPPPFFNATQLASIFSRHGFSVQEMVVLSGAHTLGVARCSSFRDRLAAASATATTSDFVSSLSATCSRGPTAEQAFDTSRNDFDNAYFHKVLQGNGLLTSDHALYTSPTTRSHVAAYGRNEAMFFYDFQRAMRKMGMLALKDDSNGEVRSNCRAIN